MNIGLINPNKEIKEPAIHLGLGYLTSYVIQQDNNINFEILDTRVATKKERDHFFSQPFDLIGITASSQVFEEALELGEEIKAEKPHVPLIIGGSHASTVKEEILQDTPFDYAAYGEGEITFWEFIQYIKNPLNIEAIDGLIYKDKEGNIHRNNPRVIISDIDTIPFPAFHLFPMERYPQHRMITSRGCPHECVFCNSRSIWTNKWRRRSAENIIEEIQYLVDNFSLKSFVFNDDSFNIDLKRVEKVCDYMIDKKMGIIWTTSIRADRVTPVIAEKMKKAGCYNVSIGIESANNEMLEKIRKHTTKEKIYEGIQILRKAGLDVMGQFMIGNPGDTLETIKESIEFAKTSNLTGVEFYTALPYKDSILYDFVQAHGTMLTDKPSYEFHKVNPRIVFETPEFTHDQRMEAINIAISNGYYHALSTDHKSFMLDFGKGAAKKIQKILGPSLGNKLYLFFRESYHKLFIKK